MQGQLLRQIQDTLIDLSARMSHCEDSLEKVIFQKLTDSFDQLRINEYYLEVDRVDKNSKCNQVTVSNNNFLVSPDQVNDQILHTSARR